MDEAPRSFTSLLGCPHVTAAAAAGCSILHTEDLNAGQTILGVRIENPFV